MTIDEIMKHVSITEIKGDCIRVKPNDGYMLKLGDSYTDELFCERSAIPDNLVVVPYSTYLIDSDKEKYKGMTVEEAKEMLIAEITAYDTSDKVNWFILNGMLIPWSKDDPSSPNVDKRMGLRQNIADKIALGEENISIWMMGMSFTMPCAQAEMLMRSIENYAYECFNVTAAHKVAVSELTTIEEVEKYDITAGYPAQLRMEV